LAALPAKAVTGLLGAVADDVAQKTHDVTASYPAAMSSDPAISDAALRQAGEDSFGLAAYALGGTKPGLRARLPSVGLQGAARQKKIIVDLFGGKRSQISGAFNVDPLNKQRYGVKATVAELKNLKGEKYDHFPLKEGSVDEIFATGPRERFIGDAARLLKPGGRMYITGTKGNKYRRVPIDEEPARLRLRIIQKDGPLRLFVSASCRCIVLGERHLRWRGDLVRCCNKVHCHRNCLSS